MAEPANEYQVVGPDRLSIEARLTRLEVSNKHILYMLKEMRQGLSDLAEELHEMRGELNAKSSGSGSNGNGTLRSVVIMLVGALLSLVGVKLAGGF